MKLPSKLETAILSQLWARDGMTVREMMEALPDGKQRAYTSVLSVLQAMERKGLVAHERQGNTYLYHALLRQQPTLGRVLQDVVRDFFGGSRSAAVQHLLSEEALSEAELSAVEQFIAERRAQQKSPAKRK